MSYETSKITWAHSIRLAPGVVTPGRKDPADQARKAGLIPSDLRGKTVLDVGTRDGYYAFLCEQRGARRIVALDNVKDPHGTRGFQYASMVLGSGVEYVSADFMDFEPTHSFDVVVCYGVIYHVPFPEAFLRRVASMTREALCLESAVFPSIRGKEALFDNRRARLYTDRTTRFVPTREWLRSRLWRLGFVIVREQCWVGGQVARRLPLVRRLRAPHRVVPSRYAVQARYQPD